MITLTREEAEKMLHYMDDGGTYTDDYGKLIETLRARLAQPEPEPEPVAWYWSNGIEFTIAFEKTDGHAPMYLHPPQREWQGLTDEEILDEYRQSYGDDGDLTDVYFARTIEAKLKEKNT
jgi:hypothetical protein